MNMYIACRVVSRISIAFFIAARAMARFVRGEGTAITAVRRVRLGLQLGHGTCDGLPVSDVSCTRVKDVYVYVLLV